MVLKLYIDAMSQPCRALMLFVRANSIPHQEIQVALRKVLVMSVLLVFIGEHLDDKFAAINPLKRVPVIDHDGFIITESVAQLRYLCRTIPVPDHWYPKDSIQMARVDEYLEWQHLNVRVNGAMLVRTKVLMPMLTGKPANEKRVAQFETGLEKVLGEIENIWLKENKYIAGKDLSIADLLAVAELEQPGMAGVDVKKDRPKLTAYMDLVRSRLQPHYDEVHKFVNKFKNMAMGN